MKALAVCVIVLGIGLAAVANAGNAISPADLHTLVGVGDPHWSPVDDRIVFVTSQSNAKRDGTDKNLWLIRANGKGLRQLTFHPADDFAPRWSADGRQILFLSKRDGKAKAWLMPLEGGEPRCLTHFDLAISQLQWIPKGRAISFVAKVPPAWKTGPQKAALMREVVSPETKIGVRVIKQPIYRSGSQYFGDNRPQLFTLDLDRKLITQLTSGGARVGSYGWAPDGSRAAVLFDLLPGRMNILEAKLILINPAGKQLRSLDSHRGQFIHRAQIAWQPKGDEIILTEWMPTIELLKTHLVNTRTGKWRQFSTGFDLERFSWRWSHDGRGLFALAEDQGNVHLWKVNPKTGQSRRLTSGRRQIGHHSQMFYPASLSLSGNSRRLVATETRSDRPTELVLIDAARGKISTLTKFNQAWRKKRGLLRATKFKVPLAHGPTIDAWILPPLNREKGKKYPLVLEIHGGPQTMYGEHFMAEFQILAAKGMGVLYVNCRGSTGYGEDFQRFAHRNYPGAYPDLMAAVDETIRRFDWVDSKRLGVAGGSFGGYMTAWIIGHTDRFQAAVAMRGIYDPSAALIGDIPYLMKHWFEPVLWEAPEKTWDMSALAFADRVKTPTLIIHSENDTRCAIANAEQLFIALQLHKVPSEFVRYQDEGHGLSRIGRPDRRVDRLERIANWLLRWL